MAKNALKIKDDKELCEILGISAPSLSNRKKTQSLSFNELIVASDLRNINLDWLLTGEGAMYKNQIAEPKASYQVNLKTLFPELTDKEVQVFEAEIEEKIEFNRLKKIVYENFAGAV